jgi:hypothetical protein
MDEQNEAPLWAPTDIDRQAIDVIKEIEASYVDEGLDAASAPAGGDSGNGGGVPAQAQAPAPDGESKPPAPVADPIEGAVVRELGLRDLEARLKAREEALKAREVELQSAPDWVRALDDDPAEALRKAGYDPDLVVRRVIAKRFEAQGKPVPDELKSTIESATKESSLRKELDAIKADLRRRDSESAARTYFDQVNADARAYVTKGPGEYAPTVAIVAKQNPDRVHSEIMDEISKDAAQKAARDPNLPLISYEEAAKRVEARWAPLRSALAPASAVSLPEPSTSPKSQVAGTEPPRPSTQAPATTPDRPLQNLLPWQQKQSDAEEAGIREAVAEYKRLLRQGQS